MTAPPSALDLLDQTEIWINRSGGTVRIDDIPWSYLSALQKFLENRAERLRGAIALAAFNYIEGAPSIAAEALGAAIADDDRIPALDYMARFPLYRRISGLLGDRRVAGWSAVEGRDPFENTAIADLPTHPGVALGGPSDQQWPDEGPF